MIRRRHEMPFGATVRDGGTLFRLWAPGAERVDLRLSDPERLVPMTTRADGWREAFVAGIGDGARYRYVINGDRAVPDPASRFQPLDVHGPSEVVDARRFDWSDESWNGRPWHETVLYELHIGTFTAGGTFAAAIADLDRLAELGITAIELMPVADFAGRRNWGYDGVLPFAPDASYGRPEDMKRLVAAAHQRGLMVFLDVVYNHFGPEGNYLGLYAPPFFSDRHTDWGQAINVAAGGASARDFFIENALYWLEEFNLDGLRFDAVHAIQDDSETHFLADLARRVRAATPAGRHRHLVLENDDNAAWLLAGRELYDAQWNDDFHHALHVILTGETAGYYRDYAEAPIERLGRCLVEGFAYQGEWSEHRGRARGEASAGLGSLAFVNFLQNHDQIGNRAFGDRLAKLAPAPALAAAAAILLLAPSPPLLFMGEEWGAETPFLFFCGFEGELGIAVRDGRRREFARFPAFADPAMRERIPDPIDVGTFEQSRLDRRPEATRSDLAAPYRRLLEIRHREIVPRLAGKVSGAGYQACGNLLTARWILADGSALSLSANLGEAPESVEKAVAGWRELYRVGEATTDGRLAPWSVVWRLREAP
ncbi:MAG TPA: malto-oligosyltrehalose trehalohydrolase [Stellaceae bacterium]|nr:malto-oligosyltrehalose trehalohydrolase [Stellaceae bacterium]